MRKYISKIIHSIANLIYRETEGDLMIEFLRLKKAQEEIIKQIKEKGDQN